MGDESNLKQGNGELQIDVKIPHSVVDHVEKVKTDARVDGVENEHRPTLTENGPPTKRKKTRRGKTKRRHPYMKYGRKYNKMLRQAKIFKPEAPHNNNQFLLEDHGIIEELEDDNLKFIDQASSSTVTRTRDSSFSVDSEGEFYSSPDDEEQFLIKDFNDQYQSIQSEELQRMSKAELIEEYLMLENRLQQEQSKVKKNEERETVIQMQKEIDRLKAENERLSKENEQLHSKMSAAQKSDSEDSETDSSDSCSSSSSSSSSSSNKSCCSGNKSPSPSPENKVDYTQTNGHTSPPPSVEPV